VNPSTIAR
jgi:hypothetical protein